MQRTSKALFYTLFLLGLFYKGYSQQYDPNFSLYINAGGYALTYDGKSFTADQYNTGTGSYNSLFVTQPDPFKTVRLSNAPSSGPHTMQYEIPVVNGSYEVTLHFLEIYWGLDGHDGPGRRVFDVTLEGQLIEDDLDLAGTIAPDVVYSPVHTINISDGFITIDFEASINDPIISAIEIAGVDSGSSTNESYWDITGTDIHYMDGNVGIGSESPGSFKLAVNGNIRAKEVKVETANWPDYVFSEGYKLPSLKEVESHIENYGDLINIPSAKEMETNGTNLGEMNRLLLEKIEELTLYLIDNRKEIECLKTYLKIQNKH